MPQPGEPYPTGWLYIEVLRQEVKQQRPSFSNYASTEPYTTIEHYFHGRGMLSVTKKDFIDDSRVYRFLNTALRQFPEDCNDPPRRYLPVGNKRFYVVETDLSVGKLAKTHLWIPIG